MSLAPLPAEHADKGRHYEFIKAAVDDSFKNATLSRANALAATPLTNPAWYTSAPAAYRKKLAAANLKAWGSQNRVDHLLAKTDLYAFAEPLLKAKIKARHGIELDVKSTFLRLYLPKDRPWYTGNFSAGVVTARQVSLLDAALHNFAGNEKVESGSDLHQPARCKRGNCSMSCRSDRRHAHQPVPVAVPRAGHRRAVQKASGNLAAARMNP
jgi:hypothetical protein